MNDMTTGTVGGRKHFHEEAQVMSGADTKRHMPNQLFVSRHAVEMPDKAAMESFLKHIGREIGDA